MAAGTSPPVSNNISAGSSSFPQVFKPLIGGYDAEFTQPLNLDYQCPICQLAFRDPVQTRDCGHRFCESCLEPILRKSPALCPIDRSALTREKVYPDKACRRTVLSLSVKCYHSGDECNWTGELSNLFCHLESCDKAPVRCINNCGRTDIPRNEMAAHVDVEGDCPLALVLCPYNDIGCKFKTQRSEMEKHLAESTQTHLDLAHLRIKDLEAARQDHICTNGRFLWKISNYSQLFFQSATKKEKEKLCSPPFYTGQHGYKLRAEAFLNGLGQGKGTHLSLYVVIMKGEYDAILPWPFQQRVDFILIDQDDDINERQNKVWRLSCERNSDYFKRPNKIKSLGFGCPKFVSLDILKTRSYIRDNTIFVRIDVESLDAP